VLISSYVKIISFRFSIRLSFLVFESLNNKIFGFISEWNYSEAKRSGYNDVFSTLINKAPALVYNLLIPIINILAGTATLVSIFMLVVFLGFWALLPGVLLIGILYVLVLRFYKKRLIRNSSIVSGQSDLEFRLLSNVNNTVRDIHLYSKYEEFQLMFARIESRLRGSQKWNYIDSSMPRLYLEGLVLLLVASALVFSLDSEQTAFLSGFAVVALAAQKALPAMSLVFTSLSNIQANQSQVNDYLLLLNLKHQSMEGDLSQCLIKEFESIELRDLSFSYPGGNAVLKDVNLSINKGEIVGFVGSSGGGKSTLMDIISGLIDPDNGMIVLNKILISSHNAVCLRNLVSYVHQSVMLQDGTVLKNIVFEEDELDTAWLNEVLEITCLAEHFTSLSNGLNTDVGEFGKNFSGGQIQRILLARALYMRRPVLILDEFTSALDNETEARVIENLLKSSYRPTIIMVAHKIKSLSACDKVVQVGEGNLVQLK
jgi:ATP-binding cassette, subfamily B, bacterial PglK